MAEKYFKIMVVAFFCLSGLALCNAVTSSDDKYDVTVTQTVDAEKGLNLAAVGTILEKSSNAEDFEKRLNDPASGVNNLDLNGDGKTDFVNVTEFGDDEVKGFSLTTDVAPGEVQEIATIKVRKKGDEQAAVEVKGSPTVYGNHHYHQSTWSPGFGTGLMMGYLFAPHRMYASPWSYGHYPSHYRSYSTVPADTYRNRWTGRTSSYSSSRSSRFGDSTVRSPYAGRNARSVKARLKNPTASQRRFQSRTAKSSGRSGGFGRWFSGGGGGRSSARSSSLRRSSFGSRSRSFGGK